MSSLLLQPASSHGNASLTSVMRSAAAVRWPASATSGRKFGQPVAQCQPKLNCRHGWGRGAGWHLKAAADALTAASPAGVALADDFVQDRIEFLKADMANLFTADGPDKSAYEEQIVFRDPISTYSSLSSFLLNLRFLRAAFGPELVLHDVRRTGGSELTCRWTMRMTMQFLKHISALRRFWNPELLFTGISVMQINPRTGRFCSSVDHWDAIEDRSYPSFAAVKHVAGQMFSASHRSGSSLAPRYLVVRRFAEYEVRRYDRLPVATAGTGTATNGPTTSPGQASEGGRPRLRKRELGGYFAAMTFTGMADDQKVWRQVQLLRNAMAAHGLSPLEAGYLLLEHDQASTRAAGRTDVLVQLESFEVWSS